MNITIVKAVGSVVLCLLAGATHAVAQCSGTQNISWTEISNATVQANGGITASATNNITSAFAAQQLTDGKYWEIVPNNVSSGSQLRINTVGNRNVYRRLSFGVGNLSLYDTAGTWQASTSVTTSSVIRISLEGTVLKMYKDGTLFYSFTDTLNAPLELQMYFWVDSSNVGNGLTSGIVYGNCPGNTTTYQAVTDRDPRSKPALPVLGASGTTVTDPTFGSRILRVTDAITEWDHPNRSYSSSSSSEQDVFNSNGTIFYVLGDGNESLFFSFNPQTMTSRRMGSPSDPYGGLTLLIGEGTFTYSNPNLIYGTKIEDERASVQYEFSNNH